MRRLLFLFLCMLFSHTLFAQSKTVKGRVVDENGKPMDGVQIEVFGSQTVVSDEKGIFSISTGHEIKDITLNAYKQDFKLLDWGYDKSVNRIKVMMMPTPVEVNGKLVDAKGSPISNAQVKVKGLEFNKWVSTNTTGYFKIKLPHGSDVKKITGFFVDEEVLERDAFKLDIDKREVILRSSRVIPQVVAQKEQPKPAPIEQPSEMVDEDGFDIESKSTLIVVVYDDDVSPADSILVKVDEKAYYTDEHGEFMVMADSVTNSAFEISEHDIIKKVYDFEDNYMFIHIKDANQVAQDELELEYEENFYVVFNTLEAEKQILEEKGRDLRKEINKIVEKLDREGSNVDKVAKLESYLHRLEESLVENEVAYQDAQYKTHQMLEKMKMEINTAEGEIEEITHEKEIQDKQLIFMIVISILSIVLFVIFYRISAKVRRQKEELEVVNESLKETRNELMKAQDDMLAVRDIGQKFTSTLNFEDHMLTLQESVAILLDASVFGIGVYNDLESRIEFRGFVDEEGERPYFFESLDDASSLAAWSFNNETELIINDLPNEYFLYVPEGSIDFSSQNIPTSVIYIPLTINREPLGVLTVQSYKKNAYIDINVANLKSLASYAAIALSNYNSYVELKLKNQNITDSMRYAKTIQDSLLPAASELKAQFKDIFTLFQSREIVSGDFYWSAVQKDADGKERKFLAAVDCTGHGVPGAFMSMIGSTLLNEIVNVKGITNTVEILDRLNDGVKDILKQEQMINDDGMDICLCVLEEEDEKTKVTFTGAKRPLLFYSSRKGKIDLIQGDIKSIGSMHRSNKEFTMHELLLHPGDMIYLTSDGFTDQHDLNKDKIGRGRMITMLEKYAELSADDQLKKLQKYLDEHMAGVEQRDDITVIGVRV